MIDQPNGESHPEVYAIPLDGLCKLLVHEPEVEIHELKTILERAPVSLNPNIGNDDYALDCLVNIAYFNRPDMLLVDSPLNKCPDLEELYPNGFERVVEIKLDLNHEIPRGYKEARRAGFTTGERLDEIAITEEQIVQLEDRDFNNYCCYYDYHSGITYAMYQQDGRNIVISFDFFYSNAFPTYFLPEISDDEPESEP